ncbi:membrane protein [Secundilactobacillus pentosiphilus]|uniref:Membrane protein n=1 Tax=Secundilactobacillus pentosiphilus TaxID=1714682 RepID=A0A1Z5IMN3_9LACO|nr:membrane protein [Secundilactobacillus pentosiphilus]
MVFLLSLIPVAGALISVVPLSMVAYAVGGWQSVIAIIIMIICIHALEAYVLNPRFMSSKTHLPAFFTFIVLLASEKLFGTLGLIVDLPIFTFFLDILQIKTLTKDKTSDDQGKKKAVTNN